MRRKKHKQTRRATNYFRINYGFHEPYKVLLDGNFIHATKAINLPELSSQLPKLLGGTCKLYTTKCVTRELWSMGPQFTAAATAARAFPLHKCGHEHGASCGSNGQRKSKSGKDELEDTADEEESEEDGGDRQREGTGGGSMSACDCIRAVIGRSNEQHWFVATQDYALRKELGKIPGCPLVFATVNGIHLETPSEVTLQKSREAEAASRALAPHERAAEPLLREEQLAELRRAEQLKRAVASAALKGGHGGGTLPPTTTSARFRRNRAKGPNPLASKKKIKKPRGQKQQQVDKRKAEDAPVAAEAAGQQQQGAKRRRKRA